MKTTAELMLTVGRRIRFFLNDGADLHDIAKQNKLDPVKCLFSLKFADAVEKHPLLAVRAIFEEWNPAKIREETNKVLQQEETYEPLARR